MLSTVLTNYLALMVHGGGNCLCTRKEANHKQIRHMLQNGLVPVSADYRKCPELNVIEGPMTDVCDTLQWAREVLPNLQLNNKSVKLDGERVVVVGWSTGGHLAMTLGYTPLLRGLRPPEAILAFYSPTDYSDECTFLLLFTKAEPR